MSGIGETYWTICDTYPGHDVTALGTDHVSPGFVEPVTPHVAAMHAQGLDKIEATAAIEFVANMTLNCSVGAARLRKVKGRPEVPEHSVGGFSDPDTWTGRGWYQRHLDVHLAGLQESLPPLLEPVTSLDEDQSYRVEVGSYARTASGIDSHQDADTSHLADTR